MYGGRAEQTIPLSRLSDSSVALAKRLQGLLQKKQQAQAKLAKERKNMKIPELSPEDLKRYLVWTNSTGDEIEAAFVDAGTSGVTVLMKQNPNRPIEIPWEKLSPESQAMAEGLKQLKIKLAPKAPRLGPYIEGKKNDEGLLVSGAKLPRYLDGKWKNYNTVLESAVFDAAINSNGKTIEIWLKNESGDENSAEGGGPKGGPCMFTSEHGTIHLLRKRAGIGEIEQWPHSRVPASIDGSRKDHHRRHFG